jgi:hypothetical protein
VEGIRCVAESEPPVGGNSYEDHSDGDELHRSREPLRRLVTESLRAAHVFGGYLPVPGPTTLRRGGHLGVT